MATAVAASVKPASTGLALPPPVARALRRIVFFLHLWTGLLLGLYFVLMGLTGCLLLFENELDAAMNRSLFTIAVPGDGAKAQSLDTLIADITTHYPGVTIGTITLPQSPNQSLRVGISQEAAPTAAVAQSQRPEGGRQARRETFVNPYTGAILGDRQTGGTFFPTVLQLHRQFLLHDVGQAMNRYGVLFLIVLLISGMWLWWPSVRDFWRQFRQRVTIKRGASGRRFLFDLHNMVGFYSGFLLLVIAITGATEFWRSQTIVVVSAVTGTPMVPQEGGPGGGPDAGRRGGGQDNGAGRGRRNDDANNGNGGGNRERQGFGGGMDTQTPAHLSYATVLANAQRVFPKLPVLQIAQGRGGRGGGGRGGGGLRVIKAEPEAYGVRPRLITLNMNARDGSFVSADMPGESPLGLRVMSWLMPIHEGQWGYGGFYYIVKAIHCLAGLAPLVLFVTGFLMWWNKRQAKRMNERRKREISAAA